MLSEFSEQVFSCYDNITIDNSAYSTVIYCPSSNQNSSSIQVGVLQNSYISGYFLPKLPGDYYGDSAYTNDGLIWQEIDPVKNVPPSPESIEFIIDNENLRIQLWKENNLAVLRANGGEIWHHYREGDYEAAVELLKTYAVPEEKLAELVEPSPSVSPTTQPTMSPTPEPTETPAPTPDSSQPEPEASQAVTGETYEETPDTLETSVAATPVPTPLPTETPDSDVSEPESEIIEEAE